MRWRSIGRRVAGLAWRMLAMATMLLAAPLTLTLGGAALPPMPDTDHVLPQCEPAVVHGRAGLLALVPGAGYRCTEELARALQPLADGALVETLLHQLQAGPQDLARRNALRILGRLAGSPPGSRAHGLLHGTRAAQVRAALVALLASERNPDLLHDAIWVLDSFYFPLREVQPRLHALSTDVTHDPGVRARAADAAGRLVNARTGLLHPDDIALILDGLASDLPAIRASAARTAWYLREDHLDQARRARLLAALTRAWEAAAGTPLQVPPDPPDVALNRDRVASLPGPLGAYIALARALERFTGGKTHLADLRARIEAANLPVRVQRGDIIIRTGGDGDPAAVFMLLDQTRAAFMQLLGTPQPVDGDRGAALTLIIFANRAAYREYLLGFTSANADTDGIYLEADTTLYSYWRQPGDSANSLAQSLRHEYTHYLAARYLFPGTWTDPGYHTQPRGWADEGLAELLANLDYTPDGYQMPVFARAQAEICARGALPALAGLLEQRAGYDQPGEFPYADAWAFSYYLFTVRPAGARQLYAAFRGGAYRRDAVAQRVGAPSLGTMQAEWHALMRGWCAADYGSQAPRMWYA